MVCSMLLNREQEEITSRAERRQTVHWGPPTEAPFRQPRQSNPPTVGLRSATIEAQVTRDSTRVKGGLLVARQGLVSQIRDGATQPPLEPGRTRHGGAGQLQSLPTLSPQPLSQPTSVAAVSIGVITRLRQQSRQPQEMAASS